MFMGIKEGGRRWIAGFLGLVVAGLVLARTAAAEPMPSREEMWKIIQRQQQELDALKSKQQELNDKTEAVTEVVEQQAAAPGAAAGAAPGWWQNTQLGGYGELHYNEGEKDEIDFHRFVLFVAHQFNDDIRLFSEIELEHALAGEGAEGEVELEQAYLEFDLTETQRAKAGLFLVPVGILNETHEPTTFFGVERNPVESRIIPTTWWEGGVGFAGELPADFRYDLAFHSGLETPVEGDNAFLVRSGRQKVSEAPARNGAVTGRLAWAGMPGMELGLAGQYQSDITQRALDERIDATLVNAYADILQNGFGLRALWARWDLDGAEPEAIGRDVQQGWYVEPSYRFDVPVGVLGFFARYNQYDNEAGSSADTEVEQVDLGLNYWPHPNVVLKADVALVDAPEGEEDDEILNLGLGFVF